MDFSESTKVVYNRIQKIEPENVSKIIGYLLLQDHGERDMIRLAFGPDNLIHSLIKNAKTHLGLSSNLSTPSTVSPPQVNPLSVSDIPVKFTPFSPSSARPMALTVQVPTPFCDYPPYFPNDYPLQNQLQFMPLEDQLEPANSVGSDFLSNYFYPDTALGPRASPRSPSLPEFSPKICHYFIKGFCKHGNNCRYLHNHPVLESFSPLFSPSSNDLVHDDHMFSPGSLEKLEMELTELLKSRRGFPVSIASLPMLYYDIFGKTIQAEGYLTESQRHGKTGYSLTKLLARLKNSICLIDRPHGQHSVILAEDIPKYMDYGGERNEHGGIMAGSRQIYLTFPAESIFTEQDVSNYFNQFGPVQDVRIPCQQKRMFGFVTFVFPETVKLILAKGNPHFVCGARVLVKPYREKCKLVDRKYAEKLQPPMFHGSQGFDAESELQSMPRISDHSRLLEKQIIEEYEQALEFESRRLAQMQLAAKPLNQMPYFDYQPDEIQLSEGYAEQRDFHSAERLNYLTDVLNNGSPSEGRIRHINTKYNEQDSCSSQGLNLPDSPFASPLGGGISTVT